MLYQQHPQMCFEHQFILSAYNANMDMHVYVVIHMCMWDTLFWEKMAERRRNHSFWRLISYIYLFPTAATFFIVCILSHLCLWLRKVLRDFTWQAHRYPLYSLQFVLLMKRLFDDIVDVDFHHILLHLNCSYIKVNANVLVVDFSSDFNTYIL